MGPPNLDLLGRHTSQPLFGSQLLLTFWERLYSEGYPGSGLGPFWASSAPRGVCGPQISVWHVVEVLTSYTPRLDKS